MQSRQPQSAEEHDKPQGKDITASPLLNAARTLPDGNDTPWTQGDLAQYSGGQIEDVGPRIVVLARSPEYGFGFTLRHFIVYPPEAAEPSSDLEGVLFNHRHQPLDTIFVKQVRAGSPAYLARLKTGDRIVHVNESSVCDHTYQEIVTVIQRSPVSLRLVVVPGQHDILQQIFGNTAHNPESNLNLNTQSSFPIAFGSVFTSVWSTGLTLTSYDQHSTIVSVVPSPNSVGLPQLSPTLSQQDLISSAVTLTTLSSTMPALPAHRVMTSSQHLQGRGSIATAHHTSFIQLNTNPPKSSSHPQHKRKGYYPSTKDQLSGRKHSVPLVIDRKQAVYSVKESISTRVEGGLISSPRSSLKKKQACHTNQDQQTNNHKNIRNHNYNLTRDPSKRVGIYEPVMVKSEIKGNIEPKRLERDPDGRLYEVVQTRLVQSKLGVEGREIPYTSLVTQNENTFNKPEKSFLSSYAHPSKALKLDSGTTCKPDSTDDRSNKGTSNPENILQAFSSKSPYSSDRPTQEAIDRIKKNVERKEQFLMRTNEPSYFPPKGAMVYRQYQVSPQRIVPRPIWPPTSPQTTDALGSTKVSSTRREDGHVLRRTKSQVEGSISTASGLNSSSAYSQSAELKRDARPNSLPNSLPNSPATKDISGECFFPADPTYSVASSVKSLVGNNVAKPYGTHLAEDGFSKTSKPFVSTLSRIQENIPAAPGKELAIRLETCASTTSLPTSTLTQAETPFGSQTSLTRSVPLTWVGDNERIKQLQIVSTRAKKFEAYKERDGYKSAFHRFELSRLSHRTKTINVAQMKEQFEKRRGTDASVLNKSDVDGNKTSVKSTACSGNRTVPVGGPKIHCDPPRDYLGRPLQEKGSHDRDRSHSTCSHTSLWRDRSSDVPHQSSSLARQHSFHSTLRSHFARAVGTLHRSSTGSFEESSNLRIDSSTSDGTVLEPTLGTGYARDEKATVQRREKNLLGEDHDRLVRRVSYLKATADDRTLSDSELESDDEKSPKSAPGLPNRALPAIVTADLPSPASFRSSIVLHGHLNVKLARHQGKRAGDRSWKSVWGVIRGRALLFYKDKQLALLTPLAPDDQVTLRGAEVGVANDYTKKRNVLRLSTPVGSQFLLQAESEAAMTAWLTSLTNATAQSADASSKPSHPPPIPTATSSAPDLTAGANTPVSTVGTSAPMPVLSSPDVPPEGIIGDVEMINKNLKKLTSPRRTRSPSNQWPITKARKSTGETDASPKSKTWKGRIGKHLRKIQASTNLTSPSTSLPQGASIGVCIEDCPPSSENELVPLLVALCVGVVESKGLHIQGIYRIPGNRAAVTYLTEMVNQGPDAIDLFDSRWSDVNVISSLLKQFFQKLPEPLISSDLYCHFIEASKIEDPQQRLIELKNLVQELPESHYETLHFLIKHFHTVIANSEQNKMDVKNLAIVFGPTVVRAADDNVARLVTDMSHQCRIVETLIAHGCWFFSESENEEPPSVSDIQSPHSENQTSRSEMELASQSLLLNNIPKIEGSYKETNKFVSSLISAANRIHKARYKKTEEDSHPPINQESQSISNNIDNYGTPELPDPLPMSQRRVSNMSLSSISSQIAPPATGSLTAGLDRLSTSSRDGHYFPSDSTLTSFSRDGILNSHTSLTGLGTTLSIPSTETASQRLPSASCVTTSLSKSEPSYLGDEVAIRSYTGLSARTQERIRQFEMETRAMMLQRDILSRQESKKLESSRKKVEDQLQRAKKDLETEDIFDKMAKNPSEIVPRINYFLAEATSRSSNREAVSFQSLRSITSEADHKSSQTSFTSSLTQSFADTTNSSTKDNKLSVSVTPPDQLTIHHNEGSSDLLRDITATFEEKMRSLQDSPFLSPDEPTLPPNSYFNISPTDTSNALDGKENARGSLGGKCKLYRDPSLHRRRTTHSSSKATHESPINYGPLDNQLYPEEHVSRDTNLKRSDSLTKSEKTEHNLKEKSEKRSRELQRTDTQDILREKKPKELKRSKTQEFHLLKDEFSNEDQIEALRYSTDLKSRRHNVRELKEKFEQGLSPVNLCSPPMSTHNLQPSSPGDKVSRNSAAKQSRKSRIKRRHTVGGMKDLARVAWLRVIEAANQQKGGQGLQVPSWEQIQLFIENVNESKKLLTAEQPFVSREKLDSSSTPDLDALLSIMLQPQQKEALKRRLSVRDSAPKSLHPVLESHV